MPLRTVPFLVAAGVDLFSVMEITGTLLAVRETTAPFDIQINGGSVFQGMDRGDKFPVEPFNQIKIINKTTAALSGVLVVGDGQWEDYRPTSRPQGPSRTRTLWNTVVGAAALVPGTLPFLDPADPTRATVFFRAPATNTGLILLSSDINGANLVTSLTAGQIERLAYTGSLYLFANVAADSAAVYSLHY